VLFVVAAFTGFSGHFVQKFTGKKSASGTRVTCHQKAKVWEKAEADATSDCGSHQKARCWRDAGQALTKIAKTYAVSHSTISRQ
jgi:hypothetical protein